jgi:transcriptional regulator with XRE-family HTH domain
MGRPTFKIDQARLRGLRQEQGLTQTVLACKVAALLGTLSDPTQARQYQRIEKTGKTSVKYAKALATILNVSTSLLQGAEDPDTGPDPYSYVQHIRGLLKEQLDNGTSQALRVLDMQYRQRYHDDGWECLTDDLAERIEQAQLVRNPQEIAELVTLTGIPKEQLLAPANIRGFWFIAVRSRMLDCTEIVEGATSVTLRVGDILKEHLGHLGHDSEIHLRRDKPWTRIEIVRPRVNDRMYIDIARAQPGENGLRWIDTSWREDFVLTPGLIEQAYGNADVVTDFSGRTTPGDMHRLRLVVTEHDGTYGDPLRRMVVRGEIDNLPAAFKETIAKEACTRLVFTSWLTSGLRDALVPHLVQHPAANWQISANRSGIDFKLKNRRESNHGFFEIKYRLTLTEEVRSNTFECVPMRKHHIEKLKKDIEEWLTEGYVPYETDTVVPDFEPV